MIQVAESQDRAARGEDPGVQLGAPCAACLTGEGEGCAAPGEG